MQHHELINKKRRNSLQTLAMGSNLKNFLEVNSCHRRWKFVILLHFTINDRSDFPNIFSLPFYRRIISYLRNPFFCNPCTNVSSFEHTCCCKHPRNSTIDKGNHLYAYIKRVAVRQNETSCIDPVGRLIMRACKKQYWSDTRRAKVSRVMAFCSWFRLHEPPLCRWAQMTRATRSQEDQFIVLEILF